MKRIIDNKRYDTETAEVIAAWDNGFDSSDFKACDETLYRTAKGAYFLAGSGGPLSSYAAPISGGMSGGENLRAMSKNRAYDWLVDHDCMEAIEEHFADRVVDA